MRIDEIIVELNGLAQEQAGAAHILETTRFEPELQALTPGAIADARRKAGACLAAIALLRDEQEMRAIAMAGLKWVGETIPPSRPAAPAAGCAS